MDLARLSAILETIPEAQLEIFDVMWELTGEDGKFDAEKASKEPELVNRALQQANEYVRNVQSLNQALGALCEEPTF